MKNSQSNFYALDLNNKKFDIQNDLKLLDLSKSEFDGSLKWVGSVISTDDDIVRNSLTYKGTRIINFFPILDWKIIPLCEILKNF